MKLRGWAHRAALVALILGGSAFIAGAAEAQVSVRLGRVKGPGWSRCRAAIQKALEDRDEVKLVRSGEDARIGGRIEKGGRGYVADLFVLTPERERVGKARFAGVDRRALARDIEERLWSRLGDELKGLGPAPAPAAAAPEGDAAPAPAAARAVKPAASAPPQAEARPAPPPARARPPAGPAATARAPSATADRSLGGEALRFSVGAGVYARDFSWADDLFQELAGYSLGAAPAFRLGAEWYPGAHFSDGPAGWIGLDVQAELPFAVESNREGVVFPTAASSWRLGLIGRLPLDIIEVGLGVGLAERRFAIEVSDDGFVVPDLPAVRYQTLSTRLNVNARIAELVDVGVYGGWGFMLDAGAIGRSTWFPRSTSHTASAGAQLGVHLGEGVGLFGRFDWQGAFFDLLPEPGDARVAGGAADQFFLGSAGLSFATGG